MVKAYLRYVEKASFGVVYSPGVDVHLDHSGNLVVCGALDSVQVWNAKQGELVKQLRAPEHKTTSGARTKEPPAVTRLLPIPNSTKFAAGYSDGSIRVWNLASSECEMTLNGHSRAISALRCSPDGCRLASGSRDTDIIIWDLVAQSGLFRLRSHVDAVNDLCFLPNNLLVSGSKDTLIKVWDLTVQCCVQTLVGHKHEVWSLDFYESMLVSGSSDAEVRVWKLDNANSLDFFGVLQRKCTTRVSLLRFQGAQLGVQGTGKLLELFKVRGSDKVTKKVQRRLKRLREKKATNEDLEAAKAVQCSDVFEDLPPLRTSQRQRSFCFSPNGDRVTVGLSDNSISVFDLSSSSKPLHELADGGHRSGVRAVAFSRDDSMIASASREHVKVWNVVSRRCIRTMRSGYGLCILFVPGDQHLIVGTKDGFLELYSLASAEMLQRLQAHQGSVWSIDLHPSGRGLVSGGADKEMKFWAFELANKMLSMVHTRTLRLEDDVLSVKHSPDGKYVAAALLDCTVKLFHEDSLKFFLSLYGHRLPVLSMDISSDGTLLASAGADKNLKIWGLDFGDCHKSLLAHDDSVMGVRFVPDTHYVFTCGKDKLVRYWDADKFEMIYSLPAHQSEVWALAVSRFGQSFVSAGNDRSMRLWEQTDEQVFLDEERDERLEELFDEGVVERQGERPGVLPDSGLAAPAESVAANATASLSSVKAGEKLMQALDAVELELKRRMESGHAATENPLMRGLSPSRFLLQTLRSLRPSELEVTLLVLPFDYAQRAMVLLCDLIDEGAGVELCVRCVLFLLQTHFQRFVSVANPDMIEQVRRIRHSSRKRLRNQKDQIGFNVAAIQFLQQELKDRSNADFFEAREDAVAGKKARRQQLEALESG